jgi:hypothetical protein
MVDMGNNGEISKVFYVQQGWGITRAVFQFTYISALMKVAYIRGKSHSAFVPFLLRQLENRLRQHYEMSDISMA